jgi:SPP1 family predicted phage head-tail adaptor
MSYTPIGAFSVLINLMQRNSLRDTNGEFLPDVVFAQCWAAIRAITQKYTEKQQQVITEATHKVIIHYLAGVTSALKVQLPDGRIWNIEAAADPDERQVELNLYCYERNDGQ